MNATKSKRGPASLTPEHKAAMAQGRAEGRAVRAYLEALEAHKPKRGRRRTPDSIRKRLDRIEGEMEAADQLTKLNLIQERMDLTEELGRIENKPDIAELESGFVAAAASYGERKGITYAAWRELGVPAATLRAAGIGRGS